MIPKECKRLAEVDFPVAVVSRHSAKEKSVRYGHPSTLHLWWARRPLAACRAILMGLLLPDPCDSNCPEKFKSLARNILPRVQGSVGSSDLDLRIELLRFMGDFANWDNVASPTYLEAARGLVKAAYGSEPPLVVDPFAGGGSIPLEALRLGCDAFASDLNPVACLILKTMLEDVPRRGIGFADELRKLSADIKAIAEKSLADLYPRSSNETKPIAYLWARTIICDSCGAEIPLVRSFWLSKKSKKKRALRHSVCRSKSGKVSSVSFDVFEPKKDVEVPSGTVRRGKATCICCQLVMPLERVRAQLAEQHGGTEVLFDAEGKRVGGPTLLCVVTMREGSEGRDYELPTGKDFRAVHQAQQRLKSASRAQLQHGLSAVPKEPLPPQGTLGFRVQRYGMTSWGDLFTSRQKLVMLTLLEALQQTKEHYSEQAVDFVALAVSRFSDISNALCQWESSKTQVRHLFTRQAVSMLWDFAEAGVLGGQAGDFETTLGTMIRVLESLPVSVGRAQVQIADATQQVLPEESTSVWFTDPPYYDAIPYSDLSDFFFVWLKRALPGHPLLRDPFDARNPLTPKEREAVQDETKLVQGKPKDREFFETMMARSFAVGRESLSTSGIGCVVFAHKTTEGWESLLYGIVRANWVITASWPILTEAANRLRARDSAALATSVHLICRPRADDAGVGDWASVLGELPNKVGEWIERLQAEGIRGADLVFACIGPAMEVYSRYRKVEDAEGREIPLGGDPTAIEPYKRGFLAYVWETVGRMALEQVLGTAEARARNGGAGALEEDSRLTALFLWTLQSTEVKDADTAQSPVDDDEPDDGDDEEDSPKKKKAGYTLIYDVARRFAQPLGIHLNRWEGRIIETDKGVVRLLPVAERATQLFGDADAAAMARRIEQDVKAQRNYTFAFMQDAGAAPDIRTRGKGGKRQKDSGKVETAPEPQQVTTLDRVHAAMLLQSSGQTNGLRALLREEQQRGPDFIRLANSLSALYPKDSEEKRLLDAMLLAVPRN